MKIVLQGLTNPALRPFHYQSIFSPLTTSARRVLTPKSKKPIRGQIKQPCVCQNHSTKGGGGGFRPVSWTAPEQYCKGNDSGRSTPYINRISSMALSAHIVFSKPGIKCEYTTTPLVRPEHGLQILPSCPLSRPYPPGNQAVISNTFLLSTHHHKRHLGEHNPI